MDGDGRQAHRGGSGTEVAPAGVEAFSETDVLGLEPHGGHVDTDHEAGTDGAEDQARHQQLGAAVTEGEEQCGCGHHHQQYREHPARAPVVERHADQDACRNGQRHVGDGEQLEVFGRQPVHAFQHAEL